MDSIDGELKIKKVTEAEYQDALLGLRSYSVSMAVTPEVPASIEFTRQYKRMGDANTAFWFEMQQDEAEFRKRRSR